VEVRRRIIDGWWGGGEETKEVAIRNKFWNKEGV